jgi:hypothetical protein
VTTTTETGDLPAVATVPPARSAVDEAPAEAGSGIIDPGPRPIARLRALRGQGLTGPGGVLLAVLLLAPGVLVDRWLDGSFGLPSAVAFVLASLAAASAVRTRAMATAAVLPPLLFVGALAFLAWSSGNNGGRRELALDVGTTLAVSAPVLFLGTAAALAVVLGRLVAHLFRR